MLEKLQKLIELNDRQDWINRGLRRYLYNEDIYVAAYEIMKSKEGNMTKGVDDKTLDGFSLKHVQSVIQLIKEERYNPLPTRRHYIPKRDGKKRPLGIPAVMDKVVQQAILMILECVYEGERPHFLECNHGFRGKRGTHTALREIAKGWGGVKWFVEGDIAGFFDNIDHHVLCKQLERKIDDSKFIRLIWKFLRAGYTDNGVFHNTPKGTPQGGLISPILANIYLHDFDEQVINWARDLNKGKKRQPNPEWRKLNRKKNALQAKVRSDAEERELKETKEKLVDTTSIDTSDPNFVRVHYVRYADDWLMGITGPKALANELKGKAKEYLRDELKLELHEKKTLVTSARHDGAKFLGMGIKLKEGEAKLTTVKSTQTDRPFKRRSAQVRVWFSIDQHEAIRKLRDAGYCDGDGFPIHKKSLQNQEDFQIILHYNSIKRGIFNYYRYVSNLKVLNRIDYILQYSLLKTLANKYKMSLKKVIKKFGLKPSIKRQVKKGTKIYKYWSVNSWDFATDMT